MTGDCHVLGPGQKQWVAAGTVYPQLAFAALTATAESPSLSSGRWQVEDDGANPKSGGELVELPAAAASAASSVASTDASRVGAVAAALRPADAAGVAMVPASDYPALHTARTFYRVLGWLSIVFGGLLIVVQVVSSMLTFFAMSQMGGDATQMFLTLLTLVLLGAVFATMTCAAAITFWFLADCIRWMLDLQNRAERTNILLEQLLRQQQQRDR